MIKRKGRATPLVVVLLVYCFATFIVRNKGSLEDWIDAYKNNQEATTNMIHRETSVSSPYEETNQNHSLSAPKAKSLNKTSVSFAACMMLKEDNHWLSEWLPYHYQTARLRHLLVVEDPSSRTSPNHILDRWKDRINIVQWKESNFIKKGGKKKNKKKKHKNERGKVVKSIVDRQLAFYRKCMLHFRKEQKASWLMITDSDEYLRPSHNSSVNTMDRTEEGYLADFLESTGSDRTCLTIARYQVSSQEDNHTADAQHDDLSVDTNSLHQNFNTTNFLTFRWMYHNRKNMNHGKSLINLKKLKERQVPGNLASVHQVIKGVCPPNPPGSTKDRVSNSMALMHYLGSWEQFSFRNDLRNSAEVLSRLDRWKVVGRHGVLVRDSSMSPWLTGFVQQVGMSEARRLLKDVGVVESMP